MSATVLYREERQIPDDGLEAQIFASEVRLMRRYAKTLADLDPIDCAKVDGLMIMRYPVAPEDIARFPRPRAIVHMGRRLRQDRAAGRGRA
jgi:hypothetical protein